MIRVTGAGVNAMTSSRDLVRETTTIGLTLTALRLRPAAESAPIRRIRQALDGPRSVAMRAPVARNFYTDLPQRKKRLGSTTSLDHILLGAPMGSYGSPSDKRSRESVHRLAESFSLLATLAFVGSIMIAGVLLHPDVAQAKTGEELFQSGCNACHTIGGGRLVGPDLLGVSERRSEEWLVEFVQHSQAMVEAGDPVAVALFEEHNKVPMPDQALTKAEILAVVEYAKTPHVAPGQPAAPEPDELTEEDIVLGENLFQGSVRLSNGGPSETIIWSGTVIRERCCIGNYCIIHPNVTIGADGFGYRPSPDGRGLVKIPQIGTVEIGDDVEIGAGSCVDRGKFSATSIGDGTKIDNLVQIAHNCKLGRSCVMAGQSGLSGSVTLGDGVIMGGRAGVKDHVTVGAGVKLGGYTGVISDVAPGKTLLGSPADDYRQTLRLWAAQKQLPDLIKQMKKK